MRVDGILALNSNPLTNSQRVSLTMGQDHVLVVVTTQSMARYDVCSASSWPPRASHTPHTYSFFNSSVMRTGPEP